MSMHHWLRQQWGHESAARITVTALQIGRAGGLVEIVDVDRIATYEPTEYGDVWRTLSNDTDGSHHKASATSSHATPEGLIGRIDQIHEILTERGWELESEQGQLPDPGMS